MWLRSPVHANQTAIPKVQADLGHNMEIRMDADMVTPEWRELKSKIAD
jgi:hypothetical protein